MTLDAQQQTVLLFIGLGFTLLVVALHVGEVLVLGLLLHRWLPAIIAALLLLVLGGGGVWAIQPQLRSGLRFDDVLLLVGAQLAAVVCLPAHWLHWRKRTWDRTRLQDAWTYRTEGAPWYPPTATGPSRRRGIWPFTYDRAHQSGADRHRR